MYLSYCGFYWAWNAIQGKDQDSFIHYIVPFVANKVTPGTGVNLLGGNATPNPNTPADHKAGQKPQTSTGGHQAPQTSGGSAARPGRVTGQ